MGLGGGQTALTLKKSKRGEKIRKKTKGKEKEGKRKKRREMWREERREKVEREEKEKKREKKKERKERKKGNLNICIVFIVAYSPNLAKFRIKIQNIPASEWETSPSDTSCVCTWC